jgi:hypothetical protein
MSQVAGVVRLLKTERDRLNMQLRGISAALSAFGAAYGKPKARRSKMSAAGRARIAVAQRLRWSKSKARSGPAEAVSSMPKRRTMSAAGRKGIIAAQKLRWARSERRPPKKHPPPVIAKSPSSDPRRAGFL